ncbi:hypothetical protein MBM_01985 [Drepanopeziza brunnea f. sp. 'multigermtubi' MB_m1]|uniref:Family c-likeg-protein-coupled receptor protein n=1 Tax=Marssonina brunnea f. sp. multigermtubi (strain MB_m1) TaxID=1072389 RepID=K1XGX7_MARBU|nr:uncharacterized protein MBM_01985 [Drepanopeziza brunnea f. sp. 'multigermtubi' MB_m1]EKD20033.1 hypothetical protein MBM_01985 [Drepanopeziza brunnea f. sp. 'multigermtubi' MB_m1]
MAALPGASQSMPQSKPYAPQVAGLGLIPTKSLDDPITSIFLALFLVGAIAHLLILRVNLSRGKKFLMSGLLFAFCMARIVTCTMRLVWTSNITNVSIAIAAQIFVAAGVILLFIINLIFTQRVLRASHPTWAWTKAFSLTFKLYYVSIVLMLIALIFCTVQSFYTLDSNIRRIDRDVQLVGSTYFAATAFLPLPLLALSFLLPRPGVEKFGEGRFRTKIYILLFSSFILALGAAFRAGIAYVPRPRNDPAWYHSKACFYVFNFTIEIIVVALFAVIRVDKRFHVPDGSRGPGDYAGRKGRGGNMWTEEENVDASEHQRGFLDRINTEEETFGFEIQSGVYAEVRRETRIVEIERPKGLGGKMDVRFSQVPTLRLMNQVPTLRPTSETIDAPASITKMEEPITKSDISLH